jgi:hypothetical protein
MGLDLFERNRTNDFHFSYIVPFGHIIVFGINHILINRLLVVVGNQVFNSVNNRLKVVGHERLELSEMSQGLIVGSVVGLEIGD